MQSVFEPITDFVQFDTSKRDSGIWDARNFFFDQINGLSREDLLSNLVEKYRDWVQDDQYMMFEKISTAERFFVKASKRGNDVYRKRTWKRFARLYQYKMIPRRHVWSRVIFATFTYSDRDIDVVMNRVSKDWNRTITHIRKIYGKVSVVRCYETQSDGVVHIHAILVFHDTAFKTFLHKKKRRLEEVKVNDQWIHPLKRFWEHGFSDFFAVMHWKHGLNYLSKYFMKSLELKTDRDIENVALLWIYRKRTFAVSRRLEVHCVTQTREKQFRLIAIGRLKSGEEFSGFFKIKWEIECQNGLAMNVWLPVVKS